MIGFFVVWFFSRSAVNYQCYMHDRLCDLRLVAISAISADSASTAITGGIGAIIFGLAGGILALISLIFMLIGTKRASIDEPVFNNAFVYILYLIFLGKAKKMLKEN